MSTDPGEEEVTALVVLRPAGGREITGDSVITAATLPEYAPDPGVAARVRATFEDAGFATGPVAGVSFTISGTRAAFERCFGARIRRGGDEGWLVEGGEEGARELPLPPRLEQDVHAVTFEPPAELHGGQGGWP